jgi:hypothetical protein
MVRITIISFLELSLKDILFKDIPNIHLQNLYKQNLANKFFIAASKNIAFFFAILCSLVGG